MVKVKPTGSWKHDKVDRRHNEKCWLRRVRADQSQGIGYFGGGGLKETGAVGVGDTANFGIDPIPSNYRVSIADTDTDTFYLKIHDHLMILGFYILPYLSFRFEVGYIP